MDWYKDLSVGSAVVPAGSLALAGGVAFGAVLQLVVAAVAAKLGTASTSQYPQCQVASETTSASKSNSTSSSDSGSSHSAGPQESSGKANGATSAGCSTTQHDDTPLAESSATQTPSSDHLPIGRPATFTAMRHLDLFTQSRFLPDASTWAAFSAMGPAAGSALLLQLAASVDLLFASFIPGESRWTCSAVTVR